MTTRSTRFTRDELILLPALTAHRDDAGSLVLTRKYLAGADEYARHWPGPVTSLVKVVNAATGDMDHVVYRDHEWLSGVEPRPPALADLEVRIRDAALLFPFLTPFEHDTARLSHRLGVPIVFGSEYTPRTERQIIDAEVRNPLRRLRRKLWAAQAERTRLRMLKLASGLQCSGTPCFDHYRQVFPDAFLFFDNRVPSGSIVSGERLATKLEEFRNARPLRLVFGGRLVGMKGVMHLPEVAMTLSEMGVDYQLDIYGKGPLEQPLMARIRQLGLENRVRLGGVKDFQREWLPLLTEETDLFVCCHPQGDPSSTYPEVLSCGVPIAGYDNEAFAGIVRESGAGWATPMNKPSELARQIASLARDRDALAAAAIRGREFALAHSFEETFARRARHLIGCSRLADPERAAQAESAPPR